MQQKLINCYTCERTNEKPTNNMLFTCKSIMYISLNTGANVVNYRLSMQFNFIKVVYECCTAKPLRELHKGTNHCRGTVHVVKIQLLAYNAVSLPKLTYVTIVL